METLRTEQNGVEFFTVVETGESAVSERGLALMSGVPRTTLFRWFSDLAHESVPGWLKPLLGLDLHLSHEIEIKKRGKLIKPIRAEVASKFLSLVARNLHNQEAFDTLDAIASIGLSSYIQSKTGWLPGQYKASPESHKTLSRILDSAAPWERLYDENRNKGFKWFGYRFYNDYIYSFFTAQEWCKINNLNPVRKEKNGRCDRLQRIHQYIEPATKDRLRDTVATVLGFADVSNTPEEFQELYRRKYGRLEQLALPLSKENH